jgi:hypothetical protein
MITTEAMITEKPEKQSKGSGMDYDAAGGMDF